jgi:hypothetical protein
MTKNKTPQPDFEDFDLEGFGLDDDFGPSPGRVPDSSFASKSFAAVKETLSNADFVEKQVLKAVPKEWGTAYKSVSKGFGTIGGAATTSYNELML